ncbi:unnamed protein product [Victoria cruziana]
MVYILEQRLALIILILVHKNEPNELHVIFSRDRSYGVFARKIITQITHDWNMVQIVPCSTRAPFVEVRL